MDTVQFRLGAPPRGAHEQIELLVNGRQLADVIAQVEKTFARAEGHSEIAGSYMGLAVHQLDDSPADHFLGSANSHLYCGPKDKTVLLVCRGCGEPGCWPLMARVSATVETVDWSDFEQPDRLPSWRYDEVRFVFDRRQYEAALAEIKDSYRALF